MARSRDISKVLSSNTTLATDAEVATTYQTKAAAGLTLLTPTSIVATGGSGSISTNGAVSFTSASAISLNDVFTTSYDNYRILIAIDSTTATSQQTFQIKLRASGTDKSTAYDFNMLRQFTTNATYINSTNQTSFVIGYLSTNINGTSFFALDICDPKISKATRMFANSTYGADSVRDMQTGGCVQTENYSADGFTISIGANVVTGRVSTYGYNK
jgi:hypothetical protein